MLEFLNQNAGAFTVIFTFVVALSTVIYAILTYKLVSETRRLRQVQTDPKVEIVIRPHELHITLLLVYVKNIGYGPAYDISFNLIAESETKGAVQLINDFTKSKFFETGLTYLGPNQELFSYHSSMLGDSQEKLESVLLFDIEYKNSLGTKFEETFRIDLRELKGLVKIGSVPIYKIEKHLESIKKDFNHIVSGFRRLNVNIFTENDREVERKELERRFETEDLDQNINDIWMAPK